MATLEELAEQFEDALSTSTGTTIAPGTVSPVGATVGGKKQLSWPEVVKKIQENSAFGSSEYLPTQLAGVNTNDIYKAGAKSGMLPAGLATFTKSPFSSFASRTAANPYTPKSSSATEAAAVAAQTQLTPVRGNVQQPEESWTQMDIEQMERESFDPTTLPGSMTLGTPSAMVGQLFGAIAGAVTGKTSTYQDLTMGTPEQIQYLYDQGRFGDLSTKEGRAKADGVVASWRGGQMIWNNNYDSRTDGTGYVDMVSGKTMTNDMDIADRDAFDPNNDPTRNDAKEKNMFEKAFDKFAGGVRGVVGDDIFMSNQERYAGKQGHVRDGRGGYAFVDKFGNVRGSSRADFERDERTRQQSTAVNAGFDSYADQVQAQFALDQGRGYTNPDGTTVQGGYRHFDQRQSYEKSTMPPAFQKTFPYARYIDENGIEGTGEINRAGYKVGSGNRVVETPENYVGDQFFNLDNTATSQTTDAAATGSAFGEDISDQVDSDYFGAGLDDVGYYNSGGRVAMQEGGEAPQMPMPQQPQQPQGVQGDIENLGMINEQAAAQPQNGGQQSVKDDIPREADAGDYILPYETVLLTGLNQLNRYAREAVKLAMENDINLKGTDIDPTDDVPIKVSNYEYHIPKMLVPFFGGGKKYLDKIRDEGLALRKRLEEEKQPSMQEQQPMNQNAAPAPPPQMMAEAPKAPMPMMAEGGFVLGRQEDKQSVEQSLTADTSQPTQSAYNQVQAIERSRIQKQQPPMVDPTGRVVQQGFAAPQGYKDGSTVVSDEELEADKAILSELPPEDLFALIMKSEIRDDENSEEQAKHFGSMVMNRVRDGGYGGKDLKKVLLKQDQFAGINYKRNKNHRENFKRAIRGTKVDDPYFLKYKAIAKQLMNRKLPDPTDGALFVLNRNSYEKENNLPKGSLPKYLVDVMETKQVGDLSYFNKGPKPTIKPPAPSNFISTPSMPPETSNQQDPEAMTEQMAGAGSITDEQLYNNGGFVKRVAA